jgi:Tetratricopeptide repeat
MTPQAAAALAGLAFLAPIGTARANAAVQDIRIAPHPTYVRVVIDLDAPVSFTPDAGNSFEIHGLSGGSAVMNAEPGDAPLDRVVLAPGADGSKLSFELSANVSAKAFVLTPDSSGGNRLVVDLYKQGANTTSAATQPAPSVTQPATPIQSASAEPAVPPAPASSPPAQDDTGPTAPAAYAPPMNTLQPASDETPAPAASAPGAPQAAPQEDRALIAERALDRGDPRAACASAEQALGSAPHDLRAFAVLGSCRLALGDAGGARLAFESALDADPTYHRARIGMAEAEANMGDTAAARADYQRVLADNPPADEAYKIVEAMAALRLPAAFASGTGNSSHALY